MSLKEYYNKQVEIKCTNDKVFRGFVEDYIFPDENESGNESIIIRTGNEKLVEFEEKDISEIEVI